MSKVFSRNSQALVRNAQNHVIVRFQQTTRDYAAIRGIFDRIVHNVVDHLNELVGVDFNPQIAFREITLDRVILALGFTSVVVVFFKHHVKSIQNIVEQLVQIDQLKIKLDGS